MRALFVVALLLALLARASWAQEPPNLKDRHVLGMLHLVVTGDDPGTGRPVASREGTAFFIGDGQRILTARHLFLVEDRRLRDITITARLGSYLGRAVGVDANTLRLHPEFDAAMLRADTPSLGETPLPLCFRHRPYPGQILVALGFPLGRNYDQVRLEVRSSRATGMPGFPAEAAVASGGLNRGNSGGPVLSLGGSVAGIALGGMEGAGAVDLGGVLPLHVLQAWIMQVAAIAEQCEELPPQPAPTPASTRREYSGEVILTEREIVASELVASAAVLRGVPLTRGLDGQAGRNGGPGNVGSDSGANGSPGGSGQRGEAAENGASAPDLVIRAGTLTGNLTIDNSGANGGGGGLGGTGGAGGPGARGAAATSGLFDCSSGPGKGGNGGPGGNAGDGGAAGRGGDAGRVVVVLERWSPGATLDIVARGGQAGRPGPPGAPGPGGPRGAEGSTSGNCRSAGRDGAPGAPGSPAQPGAPARSGSDAEIVLVIGGVERRAMGRLQHR